MNTRLRAALLAAAVSTAVAIVPASAHAGPPGTWTQVTGVGVNGANTDELGLARTADGVLHVAWTRSPGGTAADDLLHSAIGADGSGVSGPDMISTGLAFTFNNSTDLMTTPGGGLRVLFSGLSGTNPPHPLSGVLATATAGPDGNAWAIQPTPVSNNADATKHPVYAASGIGGALADDGTLIGSWGDSAPGGGGYHVGLSGATLDFEFPDACCDTGPDAATGADGQLVLARNATDPTRLIATQLPSGQELVAPDSGALQTDRVSISGRSGGQPGVYVAYTSGDNPFDGFPTIWKVGDADATVVSNRRGAESTKLSPAPGGGFWLMWMENNRRIFVTRSNADLTAWGAIVKLKPPKGTTTVYDVIGDATGGSLDLLTNVDRGGALAYWHQRILPGLALKAKPKKVDADQGGKVKFKVADAGQPIAGATVKFLGETKTTNAAGKAKFEVPAGAKPGRKTATAKKGGYSKAKTKVKIKG